MHALVQLDDADARLAEVALGLTSRGGLDLGRVLGEEDLERVPVAEEDAGVEVEGHLPPI